MMFEMYLPIPHLWIIYGAMALVIEMVIGFIVEISRGLLASVKPKPLSANKGAHS